MENARPVDASGFTLRALSRQGLRLSLFVFGHSAFSPPIGSLLPSLHSALSPAHPMSVPSQSLGRALRNCLVLAAQAQNSPWGWKNRCGWEVRVLPQWRNLVGNPLFAVLQTPH